MYICTMDARLEDILSFVGQILPLRLRSGLKAFFAQNDTYVSLSFTYSAIARDHVGL